MSVQNGFYSTPSGGGAGVFDACFGLTRDPTGNRRQGHIFNIRGGNATNVDLFDMTAAATGAWTSSVMLGNNTPTAEVNAGTCATFIIL